MGNKYDLYDELGLDRGQDANALSHELSERLQALQAQGLPDGHGEVQQIKVAGNILSNPVKRSVYDQALDSSDDREVGIAELRRLATEGSLYADDSADDSSATTLFPANTPYGASEPQPDSSDQATSLTSGYGAPSQPEQTVRDSQFEQASQSEQLAQPEQPAQPSQSEQPEASSGAYIAENDQPTFTRSSSPLSDSASNISNTSDSSASSVSPATSAESGESLTGAQQQNSDSPFAGEYASMPYVPLASPDSDNNSPYQQPQQQHQQHPQSALGQHPQGGTVSARDFTEDTTPEEMFKSLPQMVKVTASLWGGIGVVASVMVLMWLISIFADSAETGGVLNGSYGAFFAVVSFFIALQVIRGNDRIAQYFHWAAAPVLFLTAVGDGIFPLTLDFVDGALTTAGSVLYLIIAGLLGAAFGLSFSGDVKNWMAGQPVGLPAPKPQPEPQQNFGQQGPHGPRGPQGPHGPQGPGAPQHMGAPQGGQPNYGAPQGFGAPQGYQGPGSHQDFGQPGNPGQSPFGQPGTPGQSPFGQPGNPGQSPFGQPGNPGQSPFGQPGTPGQSPYGQPGQSPYNQ